MTLQPGKTLTELWSELTATQRSVVKANLCTLIVRMRATQFHYYGIPGRLPYRIIDELKGTVNYAFCTTREEWDNSRVAAIWANARDAQIDEARCVTLERVQRETLCDDRAVLTHCDLSDRNILVDPTTLEVTGLIDWEMANVMPAYFEYAMARLSGGHDPWWRRELLEVLKEVLRCECESKSLSSGMEPSEKYAHELAAWNALVDVERSAQAYPDACCWTYEDGVAPGTSPDVSAK